MERVLFISSRPVYPIIGGDQIRTAQQLDFLCERYIVDVIYISNNETDVNIKTYQPRVNNSYRFYVPTALFYIQTLRFIFNDLPLQTNYYYNTKVQEFIDSNINKYDIVFCNNIRTAQYVRKHTNIERYMDFVDAISMNYDKARKHTANLLKKLIYNLDYKRVKAYERKILNEFTACAVISEIDKQFIQNE